MFFQQQSVNNIIRIILERGINRINEISEMKDFFFSFLNKRIIKI